MGACAKVAFFPEYYSYQREAWLKRGMIPVVGAPPLKRARSPSQHAAAQPLPSEPDAPPRNRPTDTLRTREQRRKHSPGCQHSGVRDIDQTELNLMCSVFDSASGTEDVLCRVFL